MGKVKDLGVLWWDALLCVEYHRSYVLAASVSVGHDGC